MRLIIDSGATKADWCLVDGNHSFLRFKTAGMNFSTLAPDALSEIIALGVSSIGDAAVCEVHLYAAGLLTGTPAYEMANEAFGKAFPGARVECLSDLPAAARAVCGHKPGIAAILGTGSGCCLYDGAQVVSTVRSGGFILGDEGGGACLGKSFLSDFVKGLVPEPLSSDFAAAFGLDYMTVVQRVYRDQAPSAFLGSLAPWILERAGEDGYARTLVLRNLESFFCRSLAAYADRDLPVGFVGGFAKAMEPYILDIAAERGIVVSTILASPMEGLINYHIQ